VVTAVCVLVNVAPSTASSSLQSTQARSLVGCAPVHTVLVTYVVEPASSVGGTMSSIAMPVLVVMEPSVSNTTTTGPAFVMVFPGTVVVVEVKIGPSAFVMVV